MVEELNTLVRFQIPRTKSLWISQIRLIFVNYENCRIGLVKKTKITVVFIWNHIYETNMSGKAQCVTGYYACYIIII